MLSAGGAELRGSRAGKITQGHLPAPFLGRILLSPQPAVVWERARKSQKVPRAGKRFHSSAPPSHHQSPPCWRCERRQHSSPQPSSAGKQAQTGAFALALSFYQLPHSSGGSRQPLLPMGRAAGGPGAQQDPRAAARRGAPRAPRLGNAPLTAPDSSGAAPGEQKHFGTWPR